MTNVGMNNALLNDPTNIIIQFIWRFGIKVIMDAKNNKIIIAILIDEISKFLLTSTVQTDAAALSAAQITAIRLVAITARSRLLIKGGKNCCTIFIEMSWVCCTSSQIEDAINHGSAIIVNINAKKIAAPKYTNFKFAVFFNQKLRCHCCWSIEKAEIKEMAVGKPKAKTVVGSKKLNPVLFFQRNERNENLFTNEIKIIPNIITRADFNTSIPIEENNPFMETIIKATRAIEGIRIYEGSPVIFCKTRLEPNKLITIA